MQLAESGEMYLETVLILSGQQACVRAVDVGEYMGYSKPSVSRAMGKLKSDGFIVVDESGFIALTETGRTVAEKIYERHRVLTEVLVSLGIDEQTALQDACRIEHDISPQTYAAICRHAEQFMQ